MDTLKLLQVAVVIFGCLMLYIAAAWFDSKHNWRFVDWMNGKTSNPFKIKQNTSATTSSLSKDTEILALKERIQVLEKIVTEPSYELNKKLNSL